MDKINPVKGPLACIDGGMACALVFWRLGRIVAFDSDEVLEYTTTVSLGKMIVALEIQRLITH